MNPSPEAVAVATILFVVIAAYALFGGADFGGGIWDLLAGSAERGAPHGRSSTSPSPRSGKPTTCG
jgi:hypothetical protein